MPRVDYESLAFENGYIYRSCEFPLADQGLVLVRGLNLDDGGYLGAGKSSIFEIFSQVQLGKGGKHDLRRKDKKSSLVNSFVGKNFYASLKLKIDGHPYEIRHYRLHDRYGNKIKVIDRVSGKDILPNDASRAPHAWIRRHLLQLDETSFFNLVYLVQELNNVMIHGAEYERRNRLTEMFNLNIYDDLQTMSKRAASLHETALSDLDTIRSELEGIELTLGEAPDQDELEEQLELAEQSLSDLQRTCDEDVQSYEVAADLLSKLSQRKEIRDRIKRIFQESGLNLEFSKPTRIRQSVVDSWKKERDNLHASFIDATNDLRKSDQRKILEGQLAKLSGRDTDEIQEELTEVKAKLTNLNKDELPQAEERAEILGSLTSVKDANQDLDALEQQLEELVKKESDLQNEIASLAGQLDDEVCPTCHRPFKMSAEEVKEKQIRLDQCRDELAKISARTHRTRRTLKDARKFRSLSGKLKIIKTNRTPDEVMRDIGKYTHRERALAAELEVSQRRVQLEADLRVLPSGNRIEFQEKADLLKREWGTKRDQCDAATSILSGLRDLERLPKSGSLSSARTEARDLKRKMREANEAVAALSAQVENMRSMVEEYRRMRRRRSTLVRTIDKQRHLVHEVECLSALKHAFGPSGLKKDRFQAILDDAANRTVPAYADILWPNRNVALQFTDKDANMSFVLSRIGEETVDTHSGLLSGGERHKAGLALLFGMRDLKEIYTRSSTNVLIIDEPFGNLDPLGTEGLISVFAMLKQKFSSIFVISHRPEVLSHPVWDKTWWAVREGNNAELYFSDPPAKYLQMAHELVKQ